MEEVLFGYTQESKFDIKKIKIHNFSRNRVLKPEIVTDFTDVK